MGSVPGAGHLSRHVTRPTLTYVVDPRLLLLLLLQCTTATPDHYYNRYTDCLSLKLVKWLKWWWLQLVQKATCISTVSTLTSDRKELTTPTTISSTLARYTVGLIHYLCQWSYVLPGICLSVCSLATSRKCYWLDFHENFTRNVSLFKEVSVKYWKSSASGSWSGIFFKASSTFFPRYVLGRGLHSVNSLLSLYGD